MLTRQTEHSTDSSKVDVQVTRGTLRDRTDESELYCDGKAGSVSIVNEDSSE